VNYEAGTGATTPKDKILAVNADLVFHPSSSGGVRPYLLAGPTYGHFSFRSGVSGIGDVSTNNFGFNGGAGPEYREQQQSLVLHRGTLHLYQGAQVHPHHGRGADQPEPAILEVTRAFHVRNGRRHPCAGSHGGAVLFLPDRVTFRSCSSFFLRPRGVFNASETGGLAAAALLMAVTAQNATAQARGYIGFGAGLSLPVGDFKDCCKTGWLGQVIAGVTGASGMIGGRIDGNYIRNSVKGTGGLHSTLLGANLDLVVTPGKRPAKVHPYLLGGSVCST
jgi:opacity protein-like surface antigen